MVAKLLERFNSGKAAAMMSLYAPEAVLIAKDGRTITDHAEIAAELERDLKLGLPLEAKARHVFVADNVAQIVLDWSIDGTGPDRKPRAPRRLGKRCPAPRRGWTLAVFDRQQSRDGSATAHLTYLPRAALSDGAALQLCVDNLFVTARTNDQGENLARRIDRRICGKEQQ
jgi:hypothetical protein